MLRVRGVSASWVFRYTSTSGRRREMGLGAARRGNSKDTGESLTSARDAAGKARGHLQAGQDPIEERQRLKDAAKSAKPGNLTDGLRVEIWVPKPADANGIACPPPDIARSTDLVMRKRRARPKSD